MSESTYDLLVLLSGYNKTKTDISQMPRWDSGRDSLDGSHQVAATVRSKAAHVTKVTKTFLYQLITEPQVRAPF